ncbi:Fe-S cluster assembly sulfur transfer protein SufU [Allocoleopsis franciscana]|uniref:Modular FeS cluster scaffolding protein NifU n=1 Tax=Allocoleopsis franciscana PCC 7113 TaxID=1173027 RepID=K9W974_9CYAN|nr:SUF system NifU family Fe-S cluster assembly protein [Allocoleopsis franciscana]AFZ16314.1 Modular FeS cluster scaffolding protein NifU [Allocoleopsis franciscana PCC 7113]
MTSSIHQRSLYQQVILEHSKKPRHQGKTDPVHGYHRGHNPMCGDTIELTVKLNQTGDRIEDVKFEGEGCAIAIASADLMADAVQGKSIQEALEMVQQFRNMMQGKAEFPLDVRKLNVLQGISQFPIRIKCATLCWHTLKAALESSQVHTSTVESEQ